MSKIVSIIIATFNAGKTLDRCLNSIIPQLSDNSELVIIDGGSKDSTLDIINKYNRHVSYSISEPDKGIYDAWNKGVKAASGDWVMFIGADDILLPNAINTYINAIKSTNEIESYDYICAHNRYVDMNGKLLRLLGEKPVWSKMRRYMAAAHVASLHNKKNLFETVGYYNLDFKICADYELLMRKKDKLKSLILDAEIAQMQVGGMSFTKKAIKEAKRIRALHMSVPSILNNILYLNDLSRFYLFKLRKSIFYSIK